MNKRLKSIFADLRKNYWVMYNPLTRYVVISNSTLRLKCRVMSLNDFCNISNITNCCSVTELMDKYDSDPKFLTDARWYYSLNDIDFIAESLPDDDIYPVVLVYDDNEVEFFEVDWASSPAKYNKEEK